MVQLTVGVGAVADVDKGVQGVWGALRSSP